MQEDYEIGRELGRGNFGVTRLAHHIPTGSLVAVKLIPRGSAAITANVERELLNQRALSGASPFVVAFREAFLTPTHLCLAMEFVGGGEVFAKVAAQGRLPEREARRLFRQLVSGVGACHALGVAHRDLKLENALLTADEPARLKIADFGYSKVVGGNGGGGLFLPASEAKSRVGTPAYIAPEVILSPGGGGGGGGAGTYDGRLADVWSLGVFLYVLLVGAYPFEPPPPQPTTTATTTAPHQQQPQQRDVVGVVRRILAGKYALPAGLALSPACADLIARLLVVDPRKRLPLEAVRAHPWFVGNVANEGGDDDPLPPEVAEDPAAAVARRLRSLADERAAGKQQQQQTEEDIRALLDEARRPGGGGGGRVIGGREAAR
jgi:serine/threonine-protein kinase SRK2